ncbi:MAG: hypothetical protein HFI63_09480 [Lachnospiraceae bacterium]|nr:hypothetical protein [Lachnospiraceae bacterium]
MKATELDKMTCSYDLQMLKAALSYFPPQPKRLLSIFVKVQELKNTFRLISSPENISSLNICSTPEGVPKQGFFDIWNEIKDYGGPEQQKMFERLNQIIQISSMYEQMSQAQTTGEPVYSETHASSFTPFRAKQAETEPSGIKPAPQNEQDESASDLAAASLSESLAEPSTQAVASSPVSPSAHASSSVLESPGKSDFRTYIRSSLSPENQALFDSYSAMFHSSGTFSGKEI